MHSWPTKDQDLQIAQHIIDKYVDLNDGNRLEVFEYVVDNRLEIKCDQPEWVIELIETFQLRYGVDTGMDVSLKVISKCMIDDSTVH